MVIIIKVNHLINRDILMVFIQEVIIMEHVQNFIRHLIVIHVMY